MLDLAVLNGYILLSSCGGEKFHSEIFDIEERAGTSWTRMAAGETLKETSHCF
jgi:hypothetical protein